MQRITLEDMDIGAPDREARASRRVTTVGIGDNRYPDRILDRLGDEAPDALRSIGDTSLLRRSGIGWLSSDQLPADLVLPALLQAARLVSEGATLVSGFHSPVERRCLELSIARGGSAVIVAARGISRYAVPVCWRTAVQEGRLLIVSMFDDRVRRPTGRTAAARNRLVAAMADEVFVAGAAPGGRLRPLVREIAARHQRLTCFDHPVNEDLILLGARPIDPA